MSGESSSSPEGASSLIALLPDVLAAAQINASLPHVDFARRLRETFPGCHFTVCSEDEVSPRLKPFIESGVAALYLLASGGHCLSFTDDPAGATGLLVAMREDS